MLAELVLVIIGIAILLQYTHSKSKPPGTPPGTVGLPFVGVWPPHNRSFDEYIDKYRKIYGETIWLKIGSRNVVVVCDYDDIMTSFNNPALLGRGNFLTSDTLHPGNQKGIVFGDGEDWRIMRRFSIRRLREGGMGKSSMTSIIVKEAEALVKDFERHVGKSTELPISVNSSSFNIIWQLVADKRFDVDDAEMHKFHAVLTEFFAQWQDKGIFILDFMPWIVKWTPEFVQNIFGKSSFQQKAVKIYELINKVVEEHKETLDEDNPRDLIDSYLIQMNKLARDQDRDPESYNAFTEEQLLAVIMNMYVGGTETTTNNLRWYILLMAKYPNIQKRVQKEIDDLIPKDSTLSLDDKENLPFFQATVHEMLRFKPILPVSLFRNAVEDTNISNYLIPKGTLVIANFLACHRNHKFWEKPEEFYPEHFLTEDKTFDQKKLQFLLTFSTGHRVCLGENVAKMTLFLMLGTLMQRFSFTAPEGEELSLDQLPEQPFFSLAKPFKLIINKR